MTNENEGYMGYFKGSMDELVSTLREGWLFTGELQKDGIPRGTRGADIEPEHFVHCISNHDQVGNRAYGERLNQVIPAGGLPGCLRAPADRALYADVVHGPGMGGLKSLSFTSPIIMMNWEKA